VAKKSALHSAHNLMPLVEGNTAALAMPCHQLAQFGHAGRHRFARQPDPQTRFDKARRAPHMIGAVIRRDHNGIDLADHFFRLGDDMLNQAGRSHLGSIRRIITPDVGRLVHREARTDSSGCFAHANRDACERGTWPSLSGM